MTNTNEQLQVQMRISSMNVLKFSQFDIQEFNVTAPGFAEFETEFMLKVYEESHEVGVETATKIKILELNEYFVEVKLLMKFMLQPFDKVIVKTNDGFQIPDPIVLNLFNITAGSLRGILHERLRGTALQNETLPMLDLSQLLQSRSEK